MIDMFLIDQLNHGVSFPLMAKSDVNGDNMNEVFAWLKAQKAPNAEGIAGTTAIKVSSASIISSMLTGTVELYQIPRQPERRGRRSVRFQR